MTLQPVTTQFAAGDRIRYHIRRDRWLPGTVVKVTPRRVVIRLDGIAHLRNTVPASLEPLEPAAL